MFATLKYGGMFHSTLYMIHTTYVFVGSCNFCHIKNHMNINSYLARAVQRKSFCKFEFSAADDRL